jgi:hypothetical protein
MVARGEAVRSDEELAALAEGPVDVPAPRAGDDDPRTAPIPV